MKTKLLTLGTVIGASLVSSGAMADVDVTGATGVITTQGSAAIGSVGQALIGLAALAVVYKWAKAAFFG
ncbi:major capsid protein [Vibrio parahaemolyticus]